MQGAETTTKATPPARDPGAISEATLPVQDSGAIIDWLLDEYTRNTARRSD